YKELAPFTYGIFLENETDEYMFMFLHNYLTAEMFWNLSLDPDKLLDHAYEKMFGSQSAPFMDKFFRIQEEIWAEKILNNRRMGPLGPEFDVAGANKLWSEIYSEKCIAELDGLLKQAESKAGGDKENLARILYMRRCFLDTVRAARQKFLDEQQSVADFNLSIPKLETPVALDGSLEDKAWSNATEIWLKALKKDAIEVHTKVRLLQDSDYLYMAVEAEEPDMDAVRRHFTEDGAEQIWSDEVLELFFAAPDRKSYRQLIINTLGKKTGYEAVLNGRSSRITGTYMSKAVAVQGKNEQGWILEIRIPWSELPCGEDGSIIANVARSRLHRPSNPAVTLYTWSPYIKSYSDALGYGRWVRGQADTRNLLGQHGNFQAEQKGRWFGLWGTNDKSAKSGDIALDDRIFLFGGRSLRIKCNGANSSESVTIRPALKPATRYRISWWVRTEGMGKDGTKGSAFPQIYNGRRNVAIPGKAVSTDMPWTHFSGEFETAPAEPDKKPVMYISLYNYKSSGTAWFDGVELVELGPAAK
ncbi:MAG: hypothetical protein J5746_03940, partial [Victivallales bacterium]|nr:hypothetical protein [Victivallales bacterium]